MCPEPFSGLKAATSSVLLALLFSGFVFFFFPHLIETS